MPAVSLASSASCARALGQTASLLFPVLLLSVPSYSRAQVVTITGIVEDSVTGEPLRGAMVYVLNGGKALTDQQGGFRLKNVNLGRDVLLVRNVGYAPRANRFTGRPTESEIDIGTLHLMPIAVALDSIAVEASRDEQNGRLADFKRRRAGSQGWFLTKKEIAERNPIVTSDLLRAAPGLVMDCATGPCIPATRRRYGFRPGNGVCDMQIILDGIPTAITVDDVPPAWIAGIEVYQGSTEGPVEFGTTGKDRNTPSSGLGPISSKNKPQEVVTPFCGTVAIWTGPDHDQR